MPSITDIERVLHNIEVKLYPNYLPGSKGAYIARTDNNKVLSVKDVCDILVTRAGFTGKPEDLYEHVNQYLDEVAYHLCDGFAVNNGYYYLYPNVGGTFNSVNDIHDHAHHPISFRFSVRAKLRRLIKNISVTVEGMADTGAFIDEFTDTEEASVNTLYVPGNVFLLHGHKIKLLGDDPSCGVYFVPVDNPAARVKVTRIVENSGSRIMGIAPKTSHLHNRIEIHTQFAGNGSHVLKTPRIITSVFTVEEA